MDVSTENKVIPKRPRINIKGTKILAEKINDYIPTIDASSALVAQSKIKNGCKSPEGRRIVAEEKEKRNK